MNENTSTQTAVTAKRKKAAAAIVAAAVLVIAAAVTCVLWLDAQSKVYTEGLDFALSADGSGYSVAGYSGSETNVIIPSKFSGLPVTGIEAYAFQNCGLITSVDIADSVTAIGDYAFSRCFSLASVTIPDGVTGIGECAFEYCKTLDSIDIPGSVKAIGALAFEACTSLDSVVIRDGVTAIGDQSFRRCTSLESVEMPESVTDIGMDAFLFTPWLNSQTDEFVLAGDGVLIKCSNLGTDIIIPDSVRHIVSGLFYCTIDLESVTIPDSVTTIGDDAFFNCISLTVYAPHEMSYYNDDEDAIDGFNEWVVTD